MRGLDWQTLQVPFIAGLNTKADPRALQPPELAIALDVQMDQLGGLQLRHPYANLSTTNLPASVRRVYGVGDELLAFTKDSLYSYTPGSGTWTSHGTHLAVKIDERAVFATTGDQVESDRAELSNVVVVAFTDTTTVYVAAYDKTTKATIMAPTATNNGASRPRLVALATKILLFAQTSGGDLGVWAIDPASPGATIGSAATTVLAAASFNSYYDVVKVPSADTAVGVCRRDVTTSHEVFRVTAGLTVTNSTKARVCDGPCAIAVSPDAASIQIIRTDTAAIVGDRLTQSSLADAATAQAVGTFSSAFACYQIAAEYRSVQDSGAYRCYVFWHSSETTGAAAFQSRSNYVDTAGSIGTEGTFVRRVGIASRAFSYDGRVYVHVVFAGASSFSGADWPFSQASLQNSYFLYRDDGFLVAKSAWLRAGGLQSSIGRLPGVALTSGTTTYSWCGAVRNIIQVGANQTKYADRGPLDITLTFDSDECRRIAKLGSTVYIASGEVLQYDGVGLYEVGFHQFPWDFGAIETNTAGSVDPGGHAFRNTLRWDNAAGEVDRSSTATTGLITISVGTPRREEFTTLKPLYVTHKTNRPIAVEVWSTAKDPTEDAPFFLCTSKDPAATTNPNRYIANDTTADTLPQLNNEFADSTLTTKEANDENSGVLESLAPPPATIIIASDTRLFLAGVAGDPDRVWYSKQRIAGRVASFHDALKVDIPAPGGDITGLALLDDTLVVFRETAIYLVPGDGFDNLGGGSNYGPARQVSIDIGAVNHESIALMPEGLIFKSRKGWYVLTQGFALQYIGGNVSAYDSETPLAVHVVETQHHVRCLTSNRCMVFDYLAKQWFEWTLASCVHATMWQGQYTKATSSTLSTERTDYTGVAYGMDIETGWIKLSDLQGFGSVRWFEALGEYRSAHDLRVRVARNYETVGTTPQWFDDKLHTPVAVAAGQPLQMRHAPSRTECQAIKVRLTATSGSAPSTLSTSAGGSWASGGTVGTSGTAWSATLASRSQGVNPTISVYTSVGLTGVEVRDHETFDGTTWNGLTNNVGVRVGGTVTVAQLETAINDASRLLAVAVADVTPTKTISDTSTLHTSVSLSGATNGSPSGEALRLTGLALEIGLKPGLFRNLPAGAKQ